MIASLEDFPQQSPDLCKCDSASASPQLLSGSYRFVSSYVCPVRKRIDRGCLNTFSGFQRHSTVQNHRHWIGRSHSDEAFRIPAFSQDSVDSQATVLSLTSWRALRLSNPLSFDPRHRFRPSSPAKGAVPRSSKHPICYERSRREHLGRCVLLGRRLGRHQ